MAKDQQDFQEIKQAILYGFFLVYTQVAFYIFCIVFFYISIEYFSFYTNLVLNCCFESLTYCYAYIIKILVQVRLDRKTGKLILKSYGVVWSTTQNSYNTHSPVYGPAEF